MKILNGIREACEEYAAVSSYANIRILIDTNDFSVFCGEIQNYKGSCIDLSIFANSILRKYSGKGSGARVLENAIIDLVFKSIIKSLVTLM
nr:MAG TPA: hypothetical protein [Caudoviricetes sp.]